LFSSFDIFFPSQRIQKLIFTSSLRLAISIDVRFVTHALLAVRAT